MNWVELKHWLSDITDLSQDALHIYAALLCQAGAAFLFRTSIARLGPWLFVLLVLAVNEVGDLLEPGRAIETWQILGGIRDLWNTMLLPTVLLLLARYAPGIMRREAPDTATESPQAALEIMEDADIR